jgi:hypothetical protein
MERLDRTRIKVTKSDRKKLRTTVPVHYTTYAFLEGVAKDFGFQDVDTLVSDLVYMYCINNRSRLLKKGFARRKPKKFVSVYASSRNLNTLNAYAYASDISFDSVINLILKQAVDKIKKNKFKIGLVPLENETEENSSTVHESVTR